jgi:dihydropyrimidinase
MYPQKGSISVGSDADIVIWDPEAEYVISAETHHMNVDYSMYEGKKVKGNVDTVLSRGQVIVQNNEFKGIAGNGSFIKRSPYGSAWD